MALLMSTVSHLEMYHLDSELDIPSMFLEKIIAIKPCHLLRPSEVVAHTTQPTTPTKGQQRYVLRLHRQVGLPPSNLDAKLKSVRGRHKACGAEAVELRCLRMRVVAVGRDETRCKAGRRSVLVDIARDRGRDDGDCSYLVGRTMTGRERASFALGSGRAYQIQDTMHSFSRCSRETRRRQMLILEDIAYEMCPITPAS
jgi:hypothetical protein